MYFPYLHEDVSMQMSYIVCTNFNLNIHLVTNMTRLIPSGHQPLPDENVRHVSLKWFSLDRRTHFGFYKKKLPSELIPAM